MESVWDSFARSAAAITGIQAQRRQMALDIANQILAEQNAAYDREMEERRFKQTQEHYDDVDRLARDRFEWEQSTAAAAEADRVAAEARAARADAQKARGAVLSAFNTTAGSPAMKRDVARATALQYGVPDETVDESIGPLITALLQQEIASGRPAYEMQAGRLAPPEISPSAPATGMNAAAWLGHSLLPMLERSQPMSAQIELDANRAALKEASNKLALAEFTRITEEAKARQEVLKAASDELNAKYAPATLSAQLRTAMANARSAEARATADRVKAIHADTEARLSHALTRAQINAAHASSAASRRASSSASSQARPMTSNLAWNIIAKPAENARVTAVAAADVLTSSDASKNPLVEAALLARMRGGTLRIDAAHPFGRFVRGREYRVYTASGKEVTGQNKEAQDRALASEMEDRQAGAIHLFGKMVGSLRDMIGSPGYDLVKQTYGGDGIPRHIKSLLATDYRSALKEDDVRAFGLGTTVKTAPKPAAKAAPKAAKPQGGKAGWLGLLGTTFGNAARAALPKTAPKTAPPVKAKGKSLRAMSTAELIRLYGK